MSSPVDHAWHLIQGLTVTAVLLLAALPVESAVQVLQPSPEAEKAASCTVPPPSGEELVTRERTIPGPRVAAGEQAPEGKPAPQQDPAHAEVCPLHLEHEPGPPPARP
jgi:hypothetical protein